MGKRSTFDRIERDYYRTFDPRAVQALKSFIKPRTTFIEPCAGDGILTDQLVTELGLVCVGEFDVEPQNSRIIPKDALTLEEIDAKDAEYIISNTPWNRKLLHPMIERFAAIRPTWLLFDANWVWTKQASPYLEYCTDIVAIGRLKWIENTTMSGKDDNCWFRFDAKNATGRTLFHGRK